MAVQSTNNILMGPATIYVGATGVITAAPSDAAVNSTPAASAWTDVGGTLGGVDFSVTPKFTPLQVDQVVDNIDDRMTSRDIMVTFTMSEILLANFALAINSTVGATGANYATLEPNYSSTASQTQKTSMVVDGFAPAVVANARARLYIPRGQQTGKVDWVNAKDKQQGLAVQFKCYYVSTIVAPYHITYQTA
jgi:hypothetical protein